MFSCEFCETFKNTFFKITRLVAASAKVKQNLISTIANLEYDLPHDLQNDLRLGNLES